MIHMALQPAKSITISPALLLVLCRYARFLFTEQEDMMRPPFHAEEQDISLERITPMHRYFKVKRKVTIKEPEEKICNTDDTNNNLLLA